MSFKNRPLGHIIVNLILLPQLMQSIKGYYKPILFFLVDPIICFDVKINMTEKTAKYTITALFIWRKEMIKKDIQFTFIFKSMMDQTSLLIPFVYLPSIQHNGFMLAFSKLSIEIFNFAFD